MFQRSIERQAQLQPQITCHERFQEFLLAWFRPVTTITSVTSGDKASSTTTVPSLTAVSFSGSSSYADTSSDEDNDDDCRDKSKRWSIAGLKKDEVNDFFAWAFFAKSIDELDLDYKTNYLNKKLNMLYYQLYSQLLDSTLKYQHY
jgi:hypothetical protein